MNMKKLIGIILFVLGYAAFAYQAILCITRQQAVDSRVTTEKTRTIPLPPILGGVALSGGIVLLIRNNRNLGRMNKWNVTQRKPWLDAEDFPRTESQSRQTGKNGSGFDS
ncbi:MAG TPA: hypothetical protein PLA90_11975 [Candidatus Sumerlaeota bacterium]|nr:hypothetical protein [Candidatus Sumerlaeota bacterium]